MVEIEPSLYAADFARLGDQIDVLLRSGARIFHFDVGDGHFVPPVTMGPIVLKSISPQIHAGGGAIDCHLMVDEPRAPLRAIAEAGGDSVTFHVEVGRRSGQRDRAGPASAACRSASPSTPKRARTLRRPPPPAPMSCSACRIQPGYSGQEFMPEAIERVRRLRALVPDGVHIQVDGGLGPENVRDVCGRGRGPARRRLVDLRAGGSAARLPAAGPRPGMSLERALELAERGRGTTLPEPGRRRRGRARRRGRGGGLARAEGRSARRGRRRSRPPASRARGATLVRVARALRAPRRARRRAPMLCSRRA